MTPSQMPVQTTDGDFSASAPLQIELCAINKHYSSFHALKDINLAVPQGSFVALVGPSGCGKSTLLRSLAGLETITSGVMKIAGDVVNKLPPRKRDVAMVFQSYALYPHMTVMENLTYSQRIRKVNIKKAQQAATEIAKTVGLSDLLDRYPKELSGGQRQRVAMGRAIIRDPKVFLFDEPLSNLDASLRVKMRKEVRDLHERLNATTVYVTHDQIEAMTMADHVVVLRDGVIEQQDTPMNLYNKPASRFVAGFIGSPAMNFTDGIVSADGESVALQIPNQPVLPLDRHVQPGLTVTVGFRPEHIEISDASNGAITLPLTATETTGSMTYLTAGSAPEFSIVCTGHARYTVGDSISFSVKAKNVHLFDKNSESSLR